MSRACLGGLLLVLLASASLSAGCSERLGELEQEARDPSDPRLACTPISVHVPDPDGEGTNWLLDEDYRHDWWCTCTTEEELTDELRAWVNERAYIACVAFVERLGHDPELSTCGELYEDGSFGGAVFPNSPYEEFLYCDELPELPVRIIVE